MWHFRHWSEVVDVSGPLGAHFEDQFCVTPPGVPRHSSEISSLLFPQLGPQIPAHPVQAVLTLHPQSSHLFGLWV